MAAGTAEDAGTKSLPQWEFRHVHLCFQTIRSLQKRPRKMPRREKLTGHLQAARDWRNGSGEDRSDDARPEFARAMAIEPDCYETNLFYALFCRSVGDYETAIRHYVDAAASDRRTIRRRTL